MRFDAPTLAHAWLAVAHAASTDLGAMGPTPMLRPRLVEGTVADATAAVLVVETRTGRLARIPWPAVALIRDAPPVHPAL